MVRKKSPSIPIREADRHERSDHHEGAGQAQRQGERPQAMRGGRRTEDNGKQRQHAGRKDRKCPRQVGQTQRCEHPSECQGEQIGDRIRIGVADRAGDLFLAPEGDQGRLNASLEVSHLVLLAVEIDAKDRQVLEFRIGKQLAQDRLLGLAGRAPGRVDLYQDRLAFALGGANACRVKGCSSAANAVVDASMAGMNRAAVVALSRNRRVIMVGLAASLDEAE